MNDKLKGFTPTETYFFRFDFGETSRIVEIMCKEGENPFQKACIDGSYKHCELYTGAPVTITDVTEEEKQKIREQAAAKLEELSGLL